jgi:nitroimidazol reductase NimA-like FMN-containing flavoprotein (pyridoxamine 5'-phosphate oxidase superfamily)
VRRLPELAVHERRVLMAVLDAGRVAHVAFVDDGRPYAIPLGYGRDGDRVIVHGSTGSRALRCLAAGAPACLTVTLLDGVVLARSAFHTSVRYRCAMVLGSFTPVPPEQREDALRVVSEHLVPGRWADVRPPSRKELAATAVLELPLEDWSVKANQGWPEDETDDLGRPVWAGVLPFEAVVGAPLAAPDLAPGIDPPSYLAATRAPTQQ